DLLRAALVGLAEVSDRYQGGHDGAPVDAVDWWTRRPCRSGYKAIEARAIALPKRCASLLQVRGCVDCRCRAEGLLRAGRDDPVTVGQVFRRVEHHGFARCDPGQHGALGTAAAAGADAAPLGHGI